MHTNEKNLPSSERTRARTRADVVERLTVVSNIEYRISNKAYNYVIGLRVRVRPFPSARKHNTISTEFPGCFQHENNMLFSKYLDVVHFFVVHVSCIFSSCMFRAFLHSTLFKQIAVTFTSVTLTSYDTTRTQVQKNRLRYIHIRCYTHIIYDTTRTQVQKKSIALHPHPLHYGTTRIKSIADHVAPASIMQTPSKKRITKYVEDDATQQGHKRSKCSNNGGTAVMQTELVDAATPNNIILPLCQPCSPHNHQSEVTSQRTASYKPVTTQNKIIGASLLMLLMIQIVP